MILWDNTSIRPVKADGFSCIEHEEGAKYKYTISFRGKDFIVDHSESNFFNLENGDMVNEGTRDYHQVKRCIKMYNLAKDGYVGTSPAQLIDGKYQINNVEVEETPKETPEMIENSPLAPDSSAAEGPENLMQSIEGIGNIYQSEQKTETTE